DCLKKNAKSTEFPYLYYDENSNSMIPCPSRNARLAIDKMHKLQRDSGIPGRYLWKFISSIDIHSDDPSGKKNQSLLIALDNAIDTISKFGLDQIQGMYLYGPTGSGKTLMSCFVLNELIRLYLAPVRYAKISRDVLGKLRASFNPNSEIYGESRKIEEELATVKALVIDDFGVHKETEWVNSVLYDLIDARYENNLLTIITSNEPMESLKEISNKRIYSRLREMCSEIHMDMPDYRLRKVRRY
ncbi:MAG: ATP-binding protein, partial [Spirochaetia bacterium]|nr:ATP-binding protein [Spirochaetia bacterium]